MALQARLIGERFGKLLVIEQGERNKSNSITWICQCDCGKVVSGYQTGTLRSGHSMSCGCLKLERVSQRSFIDLSGMRFGRLTVIRCEGRDHRKAAIWECRCDCGNVSHGVLAYSLRSGATRSCGCLQKEFASSGDHSRKHGFSGKRATREYQAWRGMRERCNNPLSISWPNYGGRGIKVCERWSEFNNLLADMGVKPAKEYQLDRIDTNGDYCPENCRWATTKEQSRNRRDNRVIEYNGEKLCLSEWSERTGLKGATIVGRIMKGWPIHDALFTPVLRRNLIQSNDGIRKDGA